MGRLQWRIVASADGLAELAEGALMAPLPKLGLSVAAVPAMHQLGFAVEASELGPKDGSAIIMIFFNQQDEPKAPSGAEGTGDSQPSAPLIGTPAKARGRPRAGPY